MRLKDPINFPILFLALIFFSSCYRDKLPVQEDELALYASSDIEPWQLYGKWEVSMIRSNVLVDINGDGTGNTNLLLETDCFDDMRIEFFEYGSFFSENAQVDLTDNSGGNELDCLGGKVNSGTWEIDLDRLILNRVEDNTVYTETKIIKFAENRFSFEVTKEESGAYVNDPGNVIDSDFQIIELEYSRSN